MVRLCVRTAVPVVAQGVVVLLVRKVSHEALPSGIVLPLTGVLRAGEAISRRELERAESVGVADPEVVLGLLGREIVHEEVDVVGDRTRRFGVGFVRRRRDEVADRQKMMTWQILILGEVSTD